MPLTVDYREIDDIRFEYPFRIIISGSSQSGKTTFAEKLLKNDHLFHGKIQRIRYCYPEFLADNPVSWHNSIETSLTYQTGIPTLEELCQLEPDTVLVLDDLYEECISTKAIDYLFRVLSGKKRISVIIMTQRFFSQGRYALNIRNCCNITILMRNSDERVNNKIASVFESKSVFAKIIEKEFKKTGYPFILVDSSPTAQITGYRLFTNIFGRFMEVYDRSGMKVYVIREKDFLNNFNAINKSTATKNEDTNVQKERCEKPAIKDSQVSSRAIEYRKRKIRENL